MSKTFTAASFTLESFRQQDAIHLDNNPYLQRQAERESNARSYPRRIPLALQAAYGVYVQDTQGQLFIDCLACAGTLALGHHHPVVVDALKQSLDAGLPLQTLDLTTPVKDRFIDELFSALPPDFSRRARIQFCGPSGSDAVEAALKLVKFATGRRTIMSFSGAYHGMTQGSLSLMGDLGPKSLPGSLSADVHFLPYPHEYRCPFGLGGDAGIDAGLHFIENLFGDPESGIPLPAAIIVEPIQGEGGVIPAPVRWLQGLRRITRKYNIALILDEIQCGIARSGQMFAFQHAGIEPDVLVLSKAIGGGLPLAVVVYDQVLDSWAPGSHAGTFRGNQLAMAAGAATLRYIQNENLAQHAASMGERLMQHLSSLQKQYPCLGHIRGRGLMIGVEIVDPSQEADRLGSYPVDTALAKAIQQHCLRQGIILEIGGRHSSVIRFLPPLIIQQDEIDEVANRFHLALKSALSERTDV